MSKAFSPNDAADNLPTDAAVAVPENIEQENATEKNSNQKSKTGEKEQRNKTGKKEQRSKTGEKEQRNKTGKKEQRSKTGEKEQKKKTARQEQGKTPTKKDQRNKTAKKERPAIVKDAATTGIAATTGAVAATGAADGTGRSRTGNGTGSARRIYLPQLVGGGYRTFWHFRGRYRVVKGSRASKKSKTTALNLICRMMKYPDANTLVVRRVYRTLKDSCFAELKWAIGRLGVQALWEAKESPLELTYLPTGQRIFFRGLDDPMKITSIAVPKGVLCWLWVEEAYEIPVERDFDLINESIRGDVPPPLFKQVTLTFNPWNERHWLKKRFFDISDPDVLALTTDYRCNEFLDEADRRLFEQMKVHNPQRYRVAGLGDWGVCEGLVFDNWERALFDFDAVRTRPGMRSVFGLDFGYAADPTALFCGLIDTERKEIYVFDELYARGLSNEAIFRELRARGYLKEVIFADAAEPKSIDRLRLLGVRRIAPARKGPDSIRSGIDFLRDFHILIHPACPAFLSEISSYVWQTDAAGNTLNAPVDRNNHLMDAMRYATASVLSGARMGF